MDPAERLTADIGQAEGCRLVAYRDTRGYWTIGYGHKLPASASGTETCTQDDADTWLAQDIDTAQNYARGLPEWEALDTPCRQNAVTELVFNLGRGGWAQFVKARAAIQAQDWRSAHDNLMDSAAYQQEPNRIVRLAGYILTGQYPD